MTVGYKVRRIQTPLSADAGDVQSPAADGPDGPEVVPSAAEVPETQEVPGEDTPSTVTAGGATGAAETPRSSGSRAPRWLTVAALAGLAGTVGFGAAWAFDRTPASPTPAVSAAARQVVLELTNFNSADVSSDFSRIQAGATGTFASQAKKVFGSSIRQELSSANSTSRGTIADLYVQSVSGHSATVFAVVSQTYTNKAYSAPVADTLRMVVGLTDVGGIWKTSSVRVLQQPVTPASTGKAAKK